MRDIAQRRVDTAGFRVVRFFSGLVDRSASRAFFGSFDRFSFQTVPEFTEWRRIPATTGKPRPVKAFKSLPIQRLLLKAVRSFRRQPEVVGCFFLTSGARTQTSPAHILEAGRYPLSRRNPEFLPTFEGLRGATIPVPNRLEDNLPSPGRPENASHSLTSSRRFLAPEQT